MDIKKIFSNGGRPRIWTDPDEMREAIEEYFQECTTAMPLIHNGEIVKNDRTGEIEYMPLDKLTITGLALALGYNDRSSIYDGINRNDEFSHIIKRALVIVENGYEKLVQGKNPTGAIFVLKNMKWKDKQEVETSGGQELKIVREVTKINE